MIVQGLRVRRVTPRLPEPPGPRSGTSGTGMPLRLLIAGDSAAAGVGAEHQAGALSGAVVDALQHDYRVSWALHARTGLRTAGVIALLETVEASDFEVALLSVGVNDVTAFTSTGKWLGQQRRHAFPALPEPLRGYLGARAQLLNEALAHFAAADASCEIVLPTLPMDPALMAADGFHPGPLAYREWGRCAAGIIQRRVSTAASRD